MFADFKEQKLLCKYIFNGLTDFLTDLILHFYSELLILHHCYTAPYKPTTTTLWSPQTANAHSTGVHLQPPLKQLQPLLDQLP